jgi:hypothetical protein
MPILLILSAGVLTGIVSGAAALVLFVEVWSAAGWTIL